MTAAAVHNHHSRLSIRRKFARISLEFVPSGWSRILGLCGCNIHRRKSTASPGAERFGNRIQVSTRAAEPSQELLHEAIQAIACLKYLTATQDIETEGAVASGKAKRIAATKDSAPRPAESPGLEQGLGYGPI